MPLFTRSAFPSDGKCDALHNNEKLNKSVGKIIRKLVIEALTNEKEIYVEEKHRCCFYGREGLWIGLPHEVIEKIVDEAEKEYLRTRTMGGPHGGFGMTVIP